MLSVSRKNSQSGFTLLELVVVFAIMSLLSTYMLGNVAVKSRQRARDTQRKTALSNIAKSLEIYFNDYGRYPAADAGGNIVGCGSGPTACTWGEEWSDANDTIYMTTLPEDERPNLNFYYDSDGLAWQLFAYIEALEDPAINGPSPDENFPDKSCGAELCNYGISSGNTTPEASL